MAMWPSWVKTRATKSKPSPSTPLVAAAAAATRRFSFSFTDPSPSLKDIQSLVHPEPARPPRVFHRLRVAASALRFLRALQPAPAAAVEVEPEVRPCVVVIYFTSLRVVRRTYEDSYTVCFILRGIGATVEERDLAMDRAYIEELAALLPCGQALTIPQVFVDGRHLGGVEEVQRLHESGELNRVVGVAASPSLAPARPSCGRCGGQRHVPCGSCDGSRKQYSDQGGDLTCDACNENGLVRCPDCLFPEAA